MPLNDISVWDWHDDADDDADDDDDGDDGAGQESLWEKQSRHIWSVDQDDFRRSQSNFALNCCSSCCAA